MYVNSYPSATNNLPMAHLSTDHPELLAFLRAMSAHDRPQDMAGDFAAWLEEIADPRAWIIRGYVTNEEGELTRDDPNDGKPWVWYDGFWIRQQTLLGMKEYSGEDCSRAVRWMCLVYLLRPFGWRPCDWCQAVGKAEDGFPCPECDGDVLFPAELPEMVQLLLEEARGMLKGEC